MHRGRAIVSLGKRLSTSEPLTEHDIAERLDKAVLRVIRIMADARQLGFHEPVRDSRYMTVNSLGILRAELDLWGVEPTPLKGMQDGEVAPT